jgi:monoamine oxidase
LGAGNNYDGKDRSYLQFLDARKGTDPETRDLALGFVESFNAADAHDASEHGLAIAGHTSEGSPAGVESSRFSVGYSSVVSRLLVGIENLSERFFMNRKVTNLKWHKGKVEVETVHRLAGVREAFTADRVIVTLPLGVLQDSVLHNEGLVIDPVPENLKNAVMGLRMGSAVRMVLGFRSPVWDEAGHESIGFLHGKADDDFPIWWTTMPIRSNRITAWRAGERARELLGLSFEERVSRALSSLSRILGRDSDDLASRLQTVHHHNWNADQFTRGAYSYVGVGGVEAARRFCEPVADTIYFAGEATFVGFSRGTVDGAISSGRRAVKQIFDR